MHFASPASPKDYARHPIHTLKVGALGTYHALGLAKAHGSVFLLASTSEIYGDPEVSPQPEKYWGHVNPIGPRSVYDEAKRFAEAISMAYYREHGVKVRIVRIFNTYGERMRLEDGRALPNFMVQALRGQTLDRVRKGKPNPQPVLCQRSGGGTLPAADVGPDRGPINWGTRKRYRSCNSRGPSSGVRGARVRLSLNRSPRMTRSAAGLISGPWGGDHHVSSGKRLGQETTLFLVRCSILRAPDPTRRSRTPRT